MNNAERHSSSLPKMTYTLFIFIILFLVLLPFLTQSEMTWFIPRQKMWHLCRLLAECSSSWFILICITLLSSIFLLDSGGIFVFVYYLFLKDSNWWCMKNQNNNKNKNKIQIPNKGKRKKHPWQKKKKGKTWSSTIHLSLNYPAFTVFPFVLHKIRL